MYCNKKKIDWCGVFGGIFVSFIISYGFLNFIIDCKTAGGFLFGDCS